MILKCNIEIKRVRSVDETDANERRTPGIVSNAQDKVASRVRDALDCRARICIDRTGRKQFAFINFSPNVHSLTDSILVYIYKLPEVLSSSFMTHFGPTDRIRIRPFQSGCSRFHSVALLNIIQL